MKKKHLERLKSIEYGYSEYGYIPLKEYREYYHLKSLRKIIKLKNINRKLSRVRSNTLDDITTLSQFDQYSVCIIGLTLKVSNISEKIGKNSAKIQRLRSQYTKFSDKWVEKKSNPIQIDYY